MEMSFSVDEAPRTLKSGTLLCGCHDTTRPTFAFSSYLVSVASFSL